MRILYIDAWDWTEDYSIYPKVYGSAPIFARYAKELLNRGGDQFMLCCHENCFRNLRPGENLSACVPLSSAQCLALQSGQPLKTVVRGADQAHLVVYHSSHYDLNMAGLEVPLAFWSPCSEPRKRMARHSLFYNDNKALQGYSYRVTIGRYVTDHYVPTPKEDFVFQCSRIGPLLNQIHVAKFCLEYGVRGIFAGRPNPDYLLQAYIDGKTTVYLGEISTEENLELCQRARLYTLCQTPPVAPFSISAIEALASGTPVCAPRDGGFSSIIQDGVNGFFWNGHNLPEIWEASKHIKQEDCWESALRFSHRAMCASFRAAFVEVLKNHQRDLGLTWRS